MHLRFLLLATALLLSGCSSPSGEADGPAAPAEGLATPAAPVEAEPVVVPPSVGHCVITRTAANTQYGFGFNADSVLYDEGQTCAFSEANATFEPFRSALVEVAWDSLSASETDVTVRLTSARCGTTVPLPTMECHEGQATGRTSPLALEVDADTLEANADANLVAYVWATGASLQREFHVYVTLFPEDEVPRDYTAVP